MATPEELAALEEAEDKEIEAGFREAMAEAVGSGDVPTPPIEKTPEPVVSDAGDQVTEPVEKYDPKAEEGATDKEVPEPTSEEKRVEIIPGFTEEELRSGLAEIPKLRKALDTTNGTYGARIQQLTATIAELQKPKKQEPVAPKEEELKELREDFEEVADKITPGIRRMIEKHTPDTASLKKEIQADVEERWNRKVQMESLAKLKAAHPDWESVAKIVPTTTGIIKFQDPKFGYWVSQQPEDIQEQIVNGSDVDFLTGKISEYKESNKEPGKKKPSKKPDLSKALVPDTSTQNGASTYASEEDEIEASFRAEMKRLAHGE